MATTKTASSSHSYLVSIETQAGTPQLSSSVEGFEDYGPLIKSSFYFEKIVSPEAGADLFSSAKINASALSITIQKGGFIAELQNTFMKGSPIEQITLLTLANIGGTNKMSDRVIFNNCYLLSMDTDQQQSDGTESATLTIRYTKFTHTVFEYKQDGTPPGQNESMFDLAKNTTEA